MDGDDDTLPFLETRDDDSVSTASSSEGSISNPTLKFGPDWEFLENEESDDEGGDVAGDVAGVFVESQTSSVSVSVPSEIVPSKNPYIQKLKEACGFKLLKKQTIAGAFNRHGELGLFHLFFHWSKFAALRNFTNDVLARKGYKPVDVQEFYAFLGLEIGASLSGCNSIKDLWWTELFKGNPVFSQVMGRARFEQIRSSFQFHTPSIKAQVAGEDPLYTVRDVMEHFQCNSYEIAAPHGVVSMDENAQPSSTLTRGTSFNPNKPQPHAFRFYCVNNHYPNYLHTMFDKGAGNRNSLWSAQC